MASGAVRVSSILIGCVLKKMARNQEMLINAGFIGIFILSFIADFSFFHVFMNEMQHEISHNFKKIRIPYGILIYNLLKILFASPQITFLQFNILIICLFKNLLLIRKLQQMICLMIFIIS